MIMTGSEGGGEASGVQCEAYLVRHLNVTSNNVNRKKLQSAIGHFWSKTTKIKGFAKAMWSTY